MKCLAQMAYEAYLENLHDMWAPDWAHLPECEQRAFLAAALAVERETSFVDREAPTKSGTMHVADEWIPDDEIVYEVEVE